MPQDVLGGEKGGSVEGDEQQLEQIEALDAEDPIPNFFYPRSRCSHDYNADVDFMVLAVGDTYILSFYCFLNHFWRL